jgi:hypothetical protein
MPSPSSVDDVLRAIAGQAESPKYIRAYHASPYDFDRFDASKIGTGEGNQAYAHGLYFAQSPSVTAEYSRRFRQLRPNTDGRWSAQTIRDAEDSLAKAGSREVAISRLEALLPSVAEDLSLRPQVEDAIAYLRGGRAPRVRTYEVEIAQPERSLLDWDSTLDAQQHLLPQVERAINKIPDPAARYDNMLAIEEPHSFRGSEVHAVLRNALGGEPAAARALMDSGVPGIRYLDGNSRRVGQGTRNYVMFPGTEDSIRILRKYGLMAPVAAGVGQGGDSP